VNMEPDKTRRIPPHQIQETAKALSGDLRLRILEALGKGTRSISQLMEALGAAQPTVSINVQILEQAGLITTAPGPNREKLCSRAHDYLLFELPRETGESLSDLEEISMPVGMYTSCSVKAPCGLAGRESLIGCPDDPRSFFLPDRSEAQLLWFSEAGFVEYLFPNPIPPEVSLKGLKISAELCSEAMGFNEDWPSDVTLFVNGKRIATVTPEGDFGREKGSLTPVWWVYGSQYGKLYEWEITGEGSFAEGRRGSGVRLADLGLRYDQPIAIRFEVEGTAVNKRGLNLFGAGYGNYNQDIKLTFAK